MAKERAGLMTDREFTEIVQETKGIVLSAIEKHLDRRHIHAIDDVAQETYFRAFRSLQKQAFREESSISTWLYTIARNEALRMNKKLGRESDKVAKKMQETSVDDAVDALSFDSDLDLLRDSIEMLPDKYRSVVVLVAEGYSVKEIAEKLQIRSGTVKSRTSRGREMLQKLMQGGMS